MEAEERVGVVRRGQALMARQLSRQPSDQTAEEERARGVHALT